MNQTEQMKHDEERLEQLYWEFDQARKKSGEERLHFKGFMRGYASHIAATKQALAAEPAKLVRLTEDEAKKAYRKGEQAAITRGIQSASHWLGLAEVMDAMIAKNGGAHATD